jgi:hypothetical protein
MLRNMRVWVFLVWHSTLTVAFALQEQPKSFGQFAGLFFHDKTTIGYLEIFIHIHIFAIAWLYEISPSTN